MTEGNPELADVMTAIGLSVFTFDANGVFRSLSGSVMQALGYPAEFLVSERPSAFLHPSDQSIAAETLLRLRTTGTPMRRRLRAVRLDGSFVPVDLVFVSALNDPAVRGFVVTAQIAENTVPVENLIDASLDAAIPDRIHLGRETLLRSVDESSGSLSDIDSLLATLMRVSGAASASISVVRQSGEFLCLFAVKDRKSGRLSTEVRSDLRIPWTGPLRDVTVGDVPILVTDIDASRGDDPNGAETWAAIFGDAHEGMLVPCTWGPRRGVVALGGPLDDVVASRLANDIATATRKTAETFLTTKYLERDQQAKYVALLENTADFVAILDRQFQFTFVSPSIARLLGATVESLVGTSCQPFIDVDSILPMLEALRFGDTRQVQIDSSHTTSGYLVVDLVVKNMTDDPLINGWIINGRDVTADTHKSDLERRAVIRRSEIAALSTVVANAPSKTFGANLWTHLKHFIELIAADRCLVWTADEGQGVLTLAAEAVNGNVEPVTGRLPEFDLEIIRSITGNERMLSNSDPFHQELEDFIRIPDAPPIGASTFFPLRSGGQLVGLMIVMRLRCEPFDEETNLHSITFADTVAAALNRRSAIELLEVQALTDSLTGLGNRRELSLAMARSVLDPTRPGGVGLLYCDVDNFKLINDSLGHDAGDEFLQETARRIRLASRSTDTLIRLGGDEFVVLLEGVGSAEYALQYARHLRRELMTPMNIRSNVLRPSFCIGVGFATRVELALDTSVLISHADTALLEAKKLGEGEIAVYDAANVSKIRTEMSLVSELNRGIERDELCLHYQPIVDLRDHRRIVSVEGLVRWNHPERGLVPPDVFIPIAEQHKMITRITSVVLEKGLRELRLARDAGALNDETALAINITVRDLRNTDFVSRVEQALALAGLDASALHVELTESAAIDDQRVFGTLLALRDIGVHIAIDDFGTGYASLSYLRDVPASLVKIDRSFVQQMDDRRDRSLIAGAIAMSHELGMPVIAEGVETAHQAAELLEMGCDYGQGYLFARPTPDLSSLRQTLAAR